MDNGKELLLEALRGGATHRPPWLPFVGCHGGMLIGRSADEYLSNADFLVDGLLKARELYRPDGLPIMFDLQIEAEILGCRLNWAAEVPPSVVSHPLAEGIEISSLPPITEDAGRMPVVIEVLQRLKPLIGDDTALYGLVCGPFTLALHLLGNDIFLKMFDDPDYVKDVIDFCSKLCMDSAEIYMANGADVIALVDPMTSQISPEHFDEFVLPYMNKVFDHIRSRGGLSSIFVCGDVTRNLELMVKSTADNICVDEQIDMVKLGKLALAENKSFGGNIKLTSVLLLGDSDDVKIEVLDIMAKCGSTGFILAPGCDLPYAVPVENMQAVADMVHDEYARQVAGSLKAKVSDSFEDIEVPDYAAEDTVVIDVITLDSASCAPCQYMVEAVDKAAAAAGVECRVCEHKIKERAGLGMMTKLGVKNLPTICINGKVKFASIIPDQSRLVAEIEAAAEV